MPSPICAGQVPLFARAFSRRLLLTGLLAAATFRLVVAQEAPANYTVGDLTFPRQPPPQYVAVDLGSGYVVDMNDNGDVLVNDFVYGVTDTYTYWSGGVATSVPTSDEDGNEYYWQFVANDGEVLGQFYGADYSHGLARWNSTDGVSSINEDDNTGDVVPDDAYGWYWPEDWNYTRDGSIYFGVEYGVQEVLATDYFDNPVGPDDGYYSKYQWSPGGGNLTQVGDTIFFGGDADFYDDIVHNETPGATITYPIVTVAGDNTLNQVFANTTYTDPSLTEIDYVDGAYYDDDDDLEYDYGAAYYFSTEDTTLDIPEPYLQLNASDVPGGVFFADDDTVDMTHMLAGLNFPAMLNNGIYDTFDGTLDYLDSDTFSPANLTANADSDTPLLFDQINSLGFALVDDSQVWLNGAVLPWANVLPYGTVNDDGTANFTVLLPMANLSANIYYEVTNLAENTTSVGGWAYDEDSGNSEAFVLVAPGIGGGAALLVDQNHDGNISLDVDDLTTAGNPYSWWLDDDPVGGGNATLRYNDPVVDGTGDLANFFPVFLNIQSLLAALPPSDTTKYYLVQADSAVNFAYTNLTRDEAFSYQTGNLESGFGPDFDQAAANATTEQVTSDGVELSGNFLSNIVNYNEGVILVEGRTDSTAPLELVVTQDDVTVADIPLYLSLGPRILLLLHGMNSDTKTWDHFVHDDFGSSTTGATNIFNGTLTGNTPPLTGNGVRCYRLQFGAYDNPGRTGLESVTSANSGNYLSGNHECGDFETFDQLGLEVNAAVQTIVGSHTNAQVVLVGHSRGGLAARDFLETTGNLTNIASVVGLLTTSTPHTGSPLGFIYGWLGTNTRGSSDPPSYTITDNTQDWNCVDFLLSKTVFIFKPKATLDVRRPVIMDVACGSDALNALNDPDAVANLSANIGYAEIVNDDVALGIMTLSPVEYSVLDPTVDYIGYAMSAPTQTYVLGGGAPSDFPGDGLVPSANQDFFLLSGFPSEAFTSSHTTTSGIIHTDAPSQTSDLNTQLNALEPAWFP